MRFVSRSLLSVAILTLSLNAWAKKEMLILGGGGEPAGNTTLFDKTLSSWGNFTKTAGWTPTVVFNGEHSNTESIAKSIAGARSSSATTANITRQLNALKQKILSGELRSGDQLMITVLSHGLEKTGSEQTHWVEAADGRFNLDRLKEIRDLAEKKGIQLAIMDDSCYSGYSLQLGTDKTCVMTTGGTSLAYVNSGQLFTQNLRPGMNLEELFLGARLSKESAYPGAPQISTYAGQKTFQITNFLSDSMLRTTSLNTYLEKNKADSCDLRSPSYKKLATELGKIEDSQFTAVRNLIGLSDASDANKELVNAMKNYDDAREKARVLLNEKEKLNPYFCIPLIAAPGQKEKKQSCSTMSLFDLNYEIAKTKPGFISKEAFQSIEMLRETPSFKKWKEAQKKYDGALNRISEQAMNVGKAERKVYEALYNHYQKGSTAPNPCRSFKL